MIALTDFAPSRQSSATRSSPTLQAARNDYHEPVLLAETLAALIPGPGRVILDATVGGGGHTDALLRAGARVIGFDQDPEAIAHVTKRFAAAGGQFTAVQTNFAMAATALDALGIKWIDGALLDLGLSSHQLAAAERGFSFLHDGPLDMRMDPSAPTTAADLVNSLPQEELESLFRIHGEEPATRRIAGHLVRVRADKLFTTTRQLAEAVERVVPRRGKIHPATRVFQALRIAVNHELEALEQGLEQLSVRLARGGRFAVISFHSLEDRLVKNFFAHRSKEWIDRREWTEPRRNPDFMFRRITRKAVAPGEIEQRANARSRSAKLRVVEKL
jgi:16S rRNA (cytosine1402-N4)-methyltransferase